MDWIEQCKFVIDSLQVDPWSDMSLYQKRLEYQRAASVLDICVNKLREDSEQVTDYERRVIASLANEIWSAGQIEYLRTGAVPPAPQATYSWEASPNTWQVPYLPPELSGWPMPAVPDVDIITK